MKVDFNVTHPSPAYFMDPATGEISARQGEGGLVEVCTMDGREWHQLGWYWSRMNPAVRDTVNTTEVISDQDQMNMCLYRAADLGVPLLAKED